MSERSYTRIIIQSSSPVRYYSEEETAQASHFDIPVIRRLHALGLIQSLDMADEERRYSEAEVERLRRIRRLRHDLGVNLAGAEVILRLCERLEELQRELDEYKGR
ncbi:MAG TPA: chaperone modulator CbpM [Ktedonobacteraceae bacterium]|jgi:MerR family transcriptional regulator/heat shock protein HspR|nr:chaperone modulator CbpM [Ktedonobacteraceae bacterium]